MSISPTFKKGGHMDHLNWLELFGTIVASIVSYFVGHGIGRKSGGQ